MKKVLVVVGIIISAVIISGIIVGLGKNEKTLFNEKIETDNNVLISIKVIESNKGWQPDKTMIISDENEHLIRYAIGFEDYTNYLPSYYFCYDINPNEYLVWVYGDDELSRFNGVVVLGNQISSHCVKEKNCLRFTNFSRTISDALANESILDMQGITEAISKHYYSNGESFDGISVAPEYQDRFDRLASEAIEYYGN